MGNGPYTLERKWLSCRDLSVSAVSDLSGWARSISHRYRIDIASYTEIWAMQRGLCTRCASHCAWPPLTFMFMMAKSALMLPMGWMMFKHIDIFAETSQHRGYVSQHVHFWCARDLICLFIFMLYALFVRLLLFSEVTMNATLTTLELWMRCEMWQSWAKRNVTKKKKKKRWAHSRFVLVLLIKPYLSVLLYVDKIAQPKTSTYMINDQRERSKSAWPTS